MWIALPLAILSEVCGFLSPKEALGGCRGVCSAWRRVQASWTHVQFGQHLDEAQAVVCGSEGSRIRAVTLLVDHPAIVGLLTCYTRLQRVELRKVRATETFRCLADLGQLTELEVKGACPITNDGLQHLSKLSKLKVLALRDTRTVTDEGMRHMAHLRKLESFCLNFTCDVTQSGVQHLALLPRLKTLDLTCGDRVRALQCLSRCQTLQSLTVESCEEFDDDGARDLPVGLRVLNLRGTAVSGESLTRLTNLQELDLSNCYHLTNIGHLVGAHSLTNLNVVACPITDNALQYMSLVPSLQCLGFSAGSRVTPEGLLHISKMHWLRRLRFDLAGRASFQHLSGLVNLQALHLSDGNVRNSEFAHLSGLQKLENLTLSRLHRTTDDALEYLRDLNLKMLRLHACPVNGLGLRYFDKLTNLHTVEIEYCTDVSDESLTSVFSLPGLRTLKLHGYMPKVSPAFRRQLDRSFTFVDGVFTLLA